MANTVIQTVEQHELGQISLPLDAEIVREQPRPEHLRQTSYDEEFDFHTLFYDTFLMANSSHVRLVGPLLFNLKPYVEEGNVSVVEGSENGSPKLVEYKLTSRQKNHRLDLFFDGSAMGCILEFDFGALGKYRVKINQNDGDLFSARRVVFTMFKYEPLTWLKDWAEFNVKYHGADALLIYHNNSVHYNTTEIAEALSEVEDLKCIVVVHWPYKYGPGANGTGRWDSTFCQLGMFEQAQARYLASAKSVLNGDIDELVITEGHVSLFDMAENSKDGYLPFGGVAIAGLDVEPEAKIAVRHRDFTALADTPHGGAVGRKWVLLPHVCHSDNLWLIHGVKRLPFDEGLSEKVTLCHFMGISTNWKEGANRGWKNARNFPQLQQAFAHIGW